MKIIPILMIAVLLTGGFTSCKKHVTEPPSGCDTCSDTTHHICDTCNLNQDSLQRVKDSLAHAFVWTEYSIPGETNLTGVWVFDSTDIIIVGNFLWHFDGKTFTEIEAISSTTGIALSGALSGFSIFALSKKDYWLVHGSIAFHTTDGKYFEDIRPGTTNACWGTSSNDIFIVGNGGQIHHFDGSKFTDMTSPTTKDLRSVWGTSHTDVWACGFNSSTAGTVLIHYDGSSWTEDPISIQKGIYATGGFNAVWAYDSSGHKFVTTCGAILLRKTDNGSWRSDSGMIPNSLGSGSWVGIAPLGNNPNDLFVTGGWGFTAHWNGKTWKKYDQLYDYSNSNYGAAGFSVKENTACMVGTKSGNSWVAIGRRK